MDEEKTKFVFWGTPDLAVFALEEMKNGGLLPSLVITVPDRPAGRGMELTPPPTKVWAEENNIPVLQPEKLDTDFTNKLMASGYELFIVAAYGKIIPQEVLDIPKHGTLNVHPSLLPKFRGPSPISSAILSGDKETGVSIMVLDEEMDHGDIVESRKSKVESLNAVELGEKLFRMGGGMLVNIIPKWVAGEIEAVEQDHDKATFSKKVTKQDGLIDLNDDAEENYRKIRGYTGWPGTYFFTEKGARVKIIDAELKDDELVIKRVIPEGKKEMDYQDFLKK